MSERVLDRNGRWRSVTVCFRASPEEVELINSQVKMSGLSKQSYIMNRHLRQEVTVIPNSRVQHALRNEMVNVYRELRRIRDGSLVSPELEAVIEVLAAEFASLGVEKHSSVVDREDEKIRRLSR